VHGARSALQAFDRHGAAGARAAGERVLGEILRHPARLSERLATMRSVHVLAMVDVLNYREHVWRLGRYEEDGDDAAGLLDAPAAAVAAPQAIERPPSTPSTTPVR
jgi:hypothetical protein